MFRCHWIALGGLCLLAAALRTPPDARAMGRHYPAARQAARGPNAPGAAPVFTCEAEGYGKSAADAEQDGMERVQRRVADYLARQRPDLGWEPAAADLRRLGVARVAGDPEEKVMDPPVGGERKLLVVKVRGELNATQLKEIEERGRTSRVQHRQGAAFRILGGVVAVLLATLGCLRLEEATRGYFSRVFRAVAVVAVMVVAAGLLLLG